MLNTLRSIAASSLLVAAAVALPVGSAMADQLNDVLSKGTIKIGVPENFPRLVP